MVFSVSGTNTATPFDISGAVTNSGHNTSPGVSISTTNSKDFIVGIVGSYDSTTITSSGSFTLLNSDGSHSSGDSAEEYLAVSAKQTNLAVGFSTGAATSYWVTMADAFVSG
jgi:hypothetical protein